MEEQNMNLFGRIFKIGQSEAHSLVDKLEDPIKLTEQGLRDMKEDLDKSLQALAEVKALAIRADREAREEEQKMKTYEQKAIQLLQAAQAGKIESAEADRLAAIALEKQAECESNKKTALKNKQQFENSVAQLDVNIKKLRNNISSWENELKTLKARAKVSEATKNVNKQLSQIDSSGTVSMLERMREKVDRDEAIAEAYGEIADESKSVDEEIDKVLEKTSSSSSDALAQLKAKMNPNSTI